MKTKGLAIESIREMAEDRAQRWQISGRSSASHTRIELQDRNAGRRQRITLWRCLILLFVVGLPAILYAQKQQGSWSNLNGLKAGQGIEVIESSMRRHAGEFLSVTDETVTLQEKGSDVSVNRKDVVRVSTASGARRGEHAVIGLVVGGAIGAGIGAAAGSSHGFLGGSSRGIAALVGIAIGAPSGAAVGAVIPAHTTIYRAAPAGAAHQTTAP